NNVHGLVDQKFSVAPLVSLVLTRGDGDPSLSSEIRKEPRVVSIDRLLKPFDSIGLNALGQIQGDGKRKEIVGIDHEFHVIAPGLTNCAHSRGVFGRILCAVDRHAHFKLVMPLGYKLFCRLDELLATILEQAKGDVCRNRGAVSTQQPPHWLAELLAFYIP